ncbi:hypothetical protein GCM10023155_21390 [Bremerella cremea]
MPEHASEIFPKETLRVASPPRRAFASAFAPGSIFDSLELNTDLVISGPFNPHDPKCKVP